MTKKLTVREKAATFKDFLFDNERRKAFDMVIPNWLSTDRLLRVIFSSVIKNPKLLDCTKESILNSVMTCATLGLEPILGRAYLIPYNNSKYIADRWVKVLECQFQPGYQGLVDLARRSGTISDVQGRVVFENDDFDIAFERDVPYNHRPWYLSDAEESGSPIGAYVNWLLKDGTKHFEFMHITDIYKRRDKSQAYQWAESGDKTKGGGKKDSVWHLWEEEMILKTVIKHSSKMVPASIEFMQAVELDSTVDSTGRAPLSFFTDKNGNMDLIGPGDSPDEPLDDEEIEENFKDFMKRNGMDPEITRQFLDKISEDWTETIIKIKASAIDREGEFVESYESFVASLKEDKEDDENADITGAEEGELFYDPEELRKCKTSGLMEFEKKHRDRIEQMSQKDREFFLDKWIRLMKHDYYAEGQPGYKEEDSSGKEKIMFQKELLEYKEILSTADFMRVLNRMDYSTIEDIPEDKYEAVIKAMKEELDKQAEES